MFVILKPLLKALLLAALRAARGYVQTNLTAFAAFLVPLIDYAEANVDAILDGLLAEMGNLPPAEQQAALGAFQAAAQGQGATP